MISMIIYVISGAIIYSVHERVRLAGGIKDRTLAYLKSHSAVNRVIYDILTSTFTPTGLTVWKKGQPVKNLNLYGNPAALSEGTMVRLQDVSGMISPLFHPKLIKTLIKYLSKDSKKSNSFSDCLSDWQDPDDLKHLNGAESYEYKSSGYPYIPRNYYIQVTEEIMLLKGFDKTLFDQIRDDLTYWGTGTINFLTMSERLLRAILQDDSLADGIIQMRKDGVLNGRKFRNLTGIVSNERYAFAPSGWIKIEVKSEAGESTDIIQTLIVKRETPEMPYMVTQWRR